MDMRHAIANAVTRLVVWTLMVCAQVNVIGMSWNARVGIDPFEAPSLLLSRLWAVALPVAFAASLVPLLWRKPPKWLAILGGIYALFGGFTVTLLTLYMLG